MLFSSLISGSGSAHGAPCCSCDTCTVALTSFPVMTHKADIMTLYLRGFCRAAGEYSLALRCAGEDMLLGGALLAVAVLPAPVAVSRCRVGGHRQHHMQLLCLA